MADKYSPTVGKNRARKIWLALVEKAEQGDTEAAKLVAPYIFEQKENKQHD